jgi:hypothetical protein
MVAKTVTPILLLLAHATKSAPIWKIRHLQAASQILRCKLPAHVSIIQ